MRLECLKGACAAAILEDAPDGVHTREGQDHEVRESHLLHEDVLFQKMAFSHFGCSCRGWATAGFKPKGPADGVITCQKAEPSTLPQGDSGPSQAPQPRQDKVIGGVRPSWIKLENSLNASDQERKGSCQAIEQEGPEKRQSTFRHLSLQHKSRILFFSCHVIHIQ